MMVANMGVEGWMGSDGQRDTLLKHLLDVVCDADAQVAARERSTHYADKWFRLLMVQRQRATRFAINYLIR